MTDIRLAQYVWLTRFLVCLGLRAPLRFAFDQFRPGLLSFNSTRVCLWLALILWIAQHLAKN